MFKPEYEEIFERHKMTSVKQKAFCIAYFDTNYNGAEAIRRAGYETEHSEKMAYEMLRKPKVKDVVADLAKLLAENTAVKPEYVLRRIMRTMDAAEMDNNHGAVLRGAELLARHLGMFIDRTEISGRDGEAIRIEKEKKVKEDVADFASTMAKLAERSRAERVSGEADGRGSSGS